MRRTIVVALVASFAVLAVLFWHLHDRNPGAYALHDKYGQRLPGSSQSPIQAPDGAEKRTAPAIAELVVEATTAAPLRDLRGEITGTVTDSRGVRVSLAAVTLDFRSCNGMALFDYDYVQSQQRIAETRTDTSGSFTIRARTNVPFVLSVSAAGFATAQREPLQAGQHVDVILRQASSIAGRVVTTANEAIVGAELFVRDITARDIKGRGVTDANGDFTINNLCEGYLALHTIAASGAIPYPTLLLLTEGRTATCTVRLESGATVGGAVYDAATLEPIAGALVATDWNEGKRVTADTSGRYAMHGFAGNRLHARADGYAGSIHRWESPLLKDDSVDFYLERGLCVTGMLLNQADEAISSAYVAAVSDNAGSEGKSYDWKPCMTDSEGRFRICGLDPHGEHALFVQRTGYATSVFDIPRSEYTDQSQDMGILVIPAPATLVCTVRDEFDNPLAEVFGKLIGTNSDRDRYLQAPASSQGIVRIAQRSSQADADGRLTFSDLAAGNYWLETSLSLGLTPTITTVTIPSAANVTELSIVMEQGGSVHGRVISESGAGLPNVIVHAQAVEKGAASGEMPRAVTKPDGSFTVRGLAFSQCEIYADPQYLNQIVDRPFMPLTWHGTARDDNSCELRLPFASTVLGSVAWADGRPASGARIKAYIEGRSQSEARSDGTGHFKVIVPVSSVVTVVAEPPSNGQGEAKPGRTLEGVAAGTTNLTIRFEHNW